jgi:hypothetical protein
MNSLVTQLLLSIGLPAACGIGVALFAKFLPTDKIAKEKIVPSAQFCAMAVHKTIGRWLKPVDEAKIENGIFITLATWMDCWIHSFMDELKKQQLNS